MFDRLCLLAHSEGWVAAGRDVVDGTLFGNPDEIAVAAGQAFVEERRKGLSPRQAYRVLKSYVEGFLDAIDAYQD